MNRSFLPITFLLLCLSLSVILVSCGDETSPATEENPESIEHTCQGVVRQYLDGNGRILRNEFSCEGACVGASCDVVFVEDGKGNRRSWCGCGEEEPNGCHLIFYKPSMGTEMIFCSGEPGCAIARDTVSMSPQGGLIEVRCARIEGDAVIN